MLALRLSLNGQASRSLKFKFCFIYSAVSRQEMLSRSSLETQKLELMSAMSELKLQQAALERENLELRATHLNNNTLPADRQPIVAAGRIRTNSTSTLHSSQNNILSASGTIPKVRFYALKFNSFLSVRM